MNTATVNVVLSIGYGRLHLISSAKFIAAVGIPIRLICGWVPRNPDGWLVRICSRLLGRDLSGGMKKRMIDYHGVEVCSLPVADFFDQGLRFLDMKLFHGKYRRGLSAFTWRFFGRVSSHHLNPESCKMPLSIFHVRSGAGQGGAIRKAKLLGMKIVCDHSIAHPAFMEKHLRDEYEKNGAMFDLGMDSPFWRQIVKDCEDADVVMVNSFFVRDTFLEQGFDEKKLKVVYLGQREDFFGLRQKKFDVSGLAFECAPNMKFKPQTSNLKLLFTGGFGFRKGGEYILEALRILKQRGIAFEMDVVGDYSSARQLIARYESEFDIRYTSHLSNISTSAYSLTFHGHKQQEELKSFLGNGDIYVFPSLAEGCAQSGMEAMAAGMCVIGTYESGFPITDGEDGYIVPCKDAVAVADRIEILNRHREDIDRVGANAAKLIAENYTWEKYAENVKKLYEEVLEE